MKNEINNEGVTKSVSAKKSRTTEFDSNGEDGFDSVLKPINQRKLVVTTSTTLQARSCRIEGQYTKFGEDDSTLQHGGRWSEGILG
jgi:hypothetical protein